MTQKKFDMAVYQSFKEIGKDFFDSKALPAWIDNTQKVVMIMQAGYDLWLSPTQAINWLYMVNGKITVYGETAILLMKQAGYQIEVLESTSQLARVKISKNGVSQEFEYTIEEAKHAGLLDSRLGIWKKYPRQMLLYKAFAYARKFFAPDCLWGYLIKEEMDWEVIEVQNIDENQALEGFEKSDVLFPNNDKDGE